MRGHTPGRLRQQHPYPVAPLHPRHQGPRNAIDHQVQIAIGHIPPLTLGQVDHSHLIGIMLQTLARHVHVIRHIPCTIRVEPRNTHAPGSSTAITRARRSTL